MKREIITNIIQSLVEKFFIIGTQLIISILLVRLLNIEDYGIMGVVLGYYVFVNVINISLESIILRDHKEYSNNLNKYFLNFSVFNVVKCICFIIVALVLAEYLVKAHNNLNFFYAIVSITAILISDSIVAPIVIYTTSTFKQKVVTRIAIYRSVLNILLTCGLFISPSMTYVAMKDLLVSLCYIILWIVYSRKLIDYKTVMRIENFDFHFIKKSLLGYSLWTHLNGVVTGFIYKSDTFFLSFFVSLSVIGNYNIALTSANVANIIPMIFGYQNSVALSHAKNDEHANRISNIFIRLSIYIGILTLIGFLVLGKFYLMIITGLSNVDVIYSYMIPIVAGLVIVKSFASPLNAFINIKGSVKSLFVSVHIPVFLATVLLYYLSSRYWGPQGVSLTNVVVAIIWLLLIIREIKKHSYNFSSIKYISDDIKYLRSFFKNGYKK
ncbi:lipopolysaccharide biosynthesis protein [Paenibacillus prosopidis]|uniref:O-antigen/teichoic acid export membrane protein n=1 Tax=Paenibacillus prosopidis TaxID=630520 RepID=A0A368W4U6_9BACL|nr:oligosaccharide flippase family protein [Paenibacillus prosopidis]RCW47886.1 O-antigen/teichoic acid export membrane protein [Paenibacillus prosopidis]